ncbi:MAG: 2,3-bisphosphoglycerate-independent phosphoglycerate mutase [Deltaproteobacteria bacterium]
MVSTSHAPRPLVLVILDGYGHRESREGNAILLARTPNLTRLEKQFPHTLIGTSGRDVGLPDGQMGNSEVGHLNFGAGRIAQMDISRIDVAIADGELGRNAVIREVLDTAKREGGRFHLLGLVSDGGVHSSLDHLEALINLASTAGVAVALHAFLDGRDTPPRSAAGFLERIAKSLAGKGAIATMSGRYWGMDRDKRWERVEKSYRCIATASAPRHTDWKQALEAAYAAGQNDEFVEPCVLGDYAGIDAAGHDAALFFNFRPDRAREITLALTAKDFTFFDRGPLRAFARYGCMTQYDATFDLPVAFMRETYPDIFPEIVAREGLTQFRCAETEKYAHVTYFFNGGREKEFQGEERKLIQSPKEVATYDKKPEMSAPEVTRSVVEAIHSGRFDFILVNFANPDMVGHTGVLPAAIEAIEVVDRGVGEIAQAVMAAGGAMFITADHGNCEMMIDPITRQPHTAHTLNKVPLIFVEPGIDGDMVRLADGGRICDVAPTMLQILGIPQPAAMTGHRLLSGKY